MKEDNPQDGEQPKRAHGLRNILPWSEYDLDIPLHASGGNSMKKQHRFDGKRCCGHHWLLNSRDHKMGGNGSGATGQGCDGQCCGGTIGISHRQDGVNLGCFYNCHTDDLGGVGFAAGHRIGQICAVQGQNQLPGFGYTYLEQYLIGADFSKSKGTGPGSCNAGTAVGTFLRKADIGAGGYGFGIVGWHQCEEICIAQDTACRPLRADRAGFTHRPLRADRAGFANGPLRSDRAGFANGPLRTDRSGFTHGPLRADSACFTDGTLRADRTLRTNGPLGAYRAWVPFRALRSDRTGDAFWPLGTNGTSDAGNTLRPDRPPWPDRPLGTGRTWRTVHTATLVWLMGAVMRFGAVTLAGVVIELWFISSVIEAIVSVQKNPSFLKLL